MRDQDIRPGVQISGNYEKDPPGHRFEIAYVSNDVVIVNMIGPNGTAPLQRERKTLRDHYHVVT